MGCPPAARVRTFRPLAYEFPRAFRVPSSNSITF